jgi:hypothetical protein
VSIKKWANYWFGRSATQSLRYLDNSEEIVRQRYSHIDAGELGDKAAEGISDIDAVPIPDN